jgi:type IV secretion system protein VirB9
MNCRSFHKIFLLAYIGFFAFAQQASALQESRAIATDSRIRTVRYSPNEVYQFVGHYTYHSIIEFESDEEIQTVSVGDSLAWLINPSGNRLFLKPVEQNATTNMSVLTNKRSYLFELHADEASDIRDPDLIFVMRFIYPQNDNNGVEFTGFEAEPDLVGDADKFNFAYSLRGIDTVAPIRVFDDGEFTFFQFRNNNTEIPAIFRVDPNGNEELINFRQRGDYVVVERVASQFTLRRGAEIVCVYNERMPQPRLPPPERTNSDRIKDMNPF